ncbi:hypothetical protein LWI29_013271 [Acer saccharum]|uniref:Uncharacterized protein n=1 Tax=Acer saccharum TaxID=4024 RepID=A0AA39VXU7_ACESA|nr:hypothetical protein LWI29_013271 [Acer saccharum]
MVDLRNKRSEADNQVSDKEGTTVEVFSRQGSENKGQRDDFRPKAEHKQIREAKNNPSKKHRGKCIISAVKIHPMITRGLKCNTNIGYEAKSRRVIWNLEKEISKVIEKGVARGIEHEARARGFEEEIAAARRRLALLSPSLPFAIVAERDCAIARRYHRLLNPPLPLSAASPALFDAVFSFHAFDFAIACQRCAASRLHRPSTLAVFLLSATHLLEIHTPTLPIFNIEQKISAEISGKVRATSSCRVVATSSCPEMNRIEVALLLPRQSDRLQSMMQKGNGGLGKKDQP